MIDLRSDTVTKPTEEMRKYMSRAEVGDDVFEEDPTVNQLQNKMANMFGFEAGLFVPSGVMANQLSINVLTFPGDEVIIEKKGHMFNYENTATALLSSVQFRPLSGNGGKLTAHQIPDNIRGDLDWEPRTRTVVLENTTNKGGGICYKKEELKEIKKMVKKHGLTIHLDGARIWNAITATSIDPVYFGTLADTMSISFSKGLGAPVGSMILSDRGRIKQIRRMRKMTGGGMRQIGILAAAAEYAVDHHLKLLKNDHRRARKLAETIQKCDNLNIDIANVETNIVIFDVLHTTAAEALEVLASYDIHMVPFGPKTIRATFHHQIDDEQLHKAIDTIEKLFN